MNEQSAKKIIFVLGGWLAKKPDGSWASPGFEDNAGEQSAPGSRLRVLAAARLFEDSPGCLIITSGGKGQLADIPDVPTLAEAMREELAALGIPEEKIIKEEQSGTTYQQLMELKKIIESGDYEEIIIISNLYHLPRVQAMIETDKSLAKLFQSNMIVLQDAEEILIRHDPEKWMKAVNEAYNSEKIRRVIEMEQRGVKQIKKGVYKFS